MEKFINDYDVPMLPKPIPPEFLEMMYERGAIRKSDLKVGASYYGRCRNAGVAVWRGECFEYQREKFGSTYPEEINHFEDDDGYDLFVPIRKVE